MKSPFLRLSPTRLLRRVPFGWLTAIAFAALFFSEVEGAGAKPDTGPNILFIYTDDQSYRTVSAYPEAFEWVDTPNIDRLAAQGVRFSHAYIGTWCMPSRATMLTGYCRTESNH